MQLCALVAAWVLVACDRAAEPSGAAPASAPAATTSEATPENEAPLASPTASASAASPSVRITKRAAKERDRYTVRLHETEARAVAPSTLDDTTLTTVQEAELVVTCLAVTGPSCSRSELVVKGHKPKKSLIDATMAMRLADAYTVDGVFAPANLSRHGEALGPEEASALIDLANVVGRMSLVGALPDEVRVGDKLPDLASAFRASLPGYEVDASVTAIDLAAGTFTHVVTASVKSNQDGIVASLDMTFNITSSAATGLPVAESSVAKMFTSYKGVSPKGEEATSLSRRTVTIAHDLR